jgi:hypothetical protein
MDAAQRKATLQALAEFQKSASFEVGEIAKTLTNETDRGVVVIMGSITEDLLLRRIFENFVPMSGDARRNMIRSGGVLSNWADRTNIARALGIIDDDDVEILDVMKAMRNACAHSRKHIDFKTKQLADALCLALDDETAAVVRAPLNALSSRMAFVLLVSYIWGRIRGETKEFASERIQGMLNNALAEAEQQLASLQTRRGQSKKADRPAPKDKEHPNRR